MGDLIFKVEADMVMDGFNGCSFTKIKERSFEDDMRFSKLKMSGPWLDSAEFVIETHKRFWTI